jgi:hypothetical protein
MQRAQGALGLQRPRRSLPGVPADEGFEAQRRGVEHDQDGKRHAQDRPQPLAMRGPSAHAVEQEQAPAQPGGEGQAPDERRRPAEGLLAGGGRRREERAALEVPRRLPCARPHQTQIPRRARFVRHAQGMEAAGKRDDSGHAARPGLGSPAQDVPPVQADQDGIAAADLQRE